jgi:hypothetical protein
MVRAIVDGDEAPRGMAAAARERPGDQSPDIPGASACLPEAGSDEIAIHGRDRPDGLCGRPGPAQRRAGTIRHDPADRHAAAREM